MPEWFVYIPLMFVSAAVILASLFAADRRGAKIGLTVFACGLMSFWLSAGAFLAELISS